MTAILVCKKLKERKEVKAKEINKEAMQISLTHKKNKWRIVTLYSSNIEEILEAIMKEIQEEEEGHLTLGGDFNARTGEEGEPIRKEEKKKREEDQRTNKYRGGYKRKVDNGREGREKMQKEREECYEENKEEEITREEMIEQLKKLKKGKAPGENGIENEAWRLMPKEVGKVLFKLLNKIWMEGGILEEWTKEII